MISVGTSGRNGIYLLNPNTLVFGIEFMAVAGAFYASIPLDPRLMRVFGVDFMRESLPGAIAFYLIAPIGMLVLLALPNTLALVAKTLLPNTYAVLVLMIATAAIHMLLMLGKPRALRKYAVPIIITALIIKLALTMNLIIIELKLTP